MSNPDNLLGLAHFCEHMLFLGTKKYPDEAEYNKVLNNVFVAFRIFLSKKMHFYLQLLKVINKNIAFHSLPYEYIWTTKFPAC